MAEPATTRHAIERVRREPKRRRLTVESVEALTPKMRRIVLTSPELADFVSLGADDHVKVFAPDAGTPQGVAMRDYTPRAFDAVRGALTIDFVLHDAGPASDWARRAKPGDPLEIGGPRGSMVVADDFDFYLLVGDETALPSIGRRVESLRAGVPVTTIVLVDGPDEIQTFDTSADWRPIWRFRSGCGRDDADSPWRGPGPMADAARRRLRLDRGGGARRANPEDSRASGPRPSQGLAQGRRLLGPRKGRREREIRGLSGARRPLDPQASRPCARPSGGGRHGSAAI